jgi:hypothetical protein
MARWTGAGTRRDDAARIDRFAHTSREDRRSTRIPERGRERAPPGRGTASARHEGRAAATATPTGGRGPAVEQGRPEGVRRHTVPPGGVGGVARGARDDAAAPGHRLGDLPHAAVLPWGEGSGYTIRGREGKRERNVVGKRSKIEGCMGFSGARDDTSPPRPPPLSSHDDNAARRPLIPNRLPPPPPPDRNGARTHRRRRSAPPANTKSNSATIPPPPPRPPRIPNSATHWVKTASMISKSDL